MSSFTYDFNLSDLKQVKNCGLKAFTTFTCGGGADIGLLMSGFDCLGGCEIDNTILEFYKTNFNHKFCFNEDIRDFVVKAREHKLPEELYNLDLLHQSPPCSTFSLSGDREKSWGVKKKFKEGQKEQRLDDLFFEAIALVGELQPKVATFENVTGLVMGKAKTYFTNIINDLFKIGYQPQAFIVDGAKLGLPQKRKRLFIVAQRNDFYRNKLLLNFNEKPITFSKIRDDKCDEATPFSTASFQLYIDKRRDDNSFSQICKRNNNKKSWFNYKIIKNNDIVPTICTQANTTFFINDMCRCINKNELLSASSFPKDYNFLNSKLSKVCWLLGMCVPPLMMHKIAEEIKKQLFNM